MNCRVWIVYCFGALFCAGPVAAQLPPAANPDSGPTAAQKRYLDGLRTAARGVAQLRDGVDRVLRTRSDTARHRAASQRLGGLCGAARGFLNRGRAQMSPVAYDDSLRIVARLLTVQVESVAGYLPTCQREASRNGERVANEVIARLRSYEAALQRYRVAVGIIPPPTPLDSGRR